MVGLVGDFSGDPLMVRALQSRGHAPFSQLRCRLVGINPDVAHGAETS